MATTRNIEFVTRGSMLALVSCLLIISTLFVLMRMMGRRIQKLAYGLDDLFLCISWLSFIAMSINMIIAVTRGAWGQPAELIEIVDKRPSINPLYLQAEEFFFIQEVIFPVQLTSIKLSILFFYRRVLCPEKRGYLHWSTFGLIILIALWGTAMLFVYLFQCGPIVSNFWSNPLEVSVQCLPSTIEWFMAISDFVLDVVVFFLPMYQLAKLHLRIKKKIMVIGVFAFGATSVVASLIRAVIYLPFMKELAANHTDVANAFIIISTIMFWGMFESGFALTAACLPSLKLYFDMATANISQRYGSQDSSKRSYYGGNAGHLRPSASTGRSSDSSQFSEDLEKGYFVTSVTSGK